MSSERVEIYSSRFDEALGFAAFWHASQRRKSTDIPYVVHPVHVAWLLREVGCDEDILIAGLLHDLLEETDLSAEELVARFGERVATIVVACSEPDKDRPWEERKGDAVARMRTMTPAARAVTSADKAHNLHTMADALERGEDLWQRFSRPAAAQLEYHRSALTALSEGWSHPILSELARALERVERLVGE